jgi:hypothetical protein
MRYETSIRSASQFFAALIGFNLKHILDAKPETGIGSHKIFFLCLSVFLFLRFFFVVAYVPAFSFSSFYYP